MLRPSKEEFLGFRRHRYNGCELTVSRSICLSIYKQAAASSEDSGRQRHEGWVTLHAYRLAAVRGRSHHYATINSLGTVLTGPDEESVKAQIRQYAALWEHEQLHGIHCTGHSSELVSFWGSYYPSSMSKSSSLFTAMLPFLHVQTLQFSVEMAITALKFAFIIGECAERFPSLLIACPSHTQESLKRE